MGRCKGIATKTGEQCKIELTNRDYCTPHENQRPVNPIQQPIIINLTGICYYMTDQQKCTEKVHDDGLCELHCVLKMRSEGKKAFMKPVGPTLKCIAAAHIHNGSLYPPDKVPIDKFQGEKKTYKQCDQCRETNRLKIANKRKDIVAKNEETADPNFRICAHPEHKGNSEYPIDKVPIEMFRYATQKDPTKLSIDCSDCRKVHSKNVMDRSASTEEKIITKGKYMCRGCIKPFDKPFVRSDGTPCVNCPDCRDKRKEIAQDIREKRKEFLKEIRLEKIMESECSCQFCKSIFLISEDERKPFVELKTYLRFEGKKKNRYVKYKDREYLSTDFLKEFRDLLELRLIEFDHVPKEEQEARGMIKPGETLIEKKCCVTECKDEYTMRQEAKITQNVCCLCHLWITKTRYDAETNKKVYKKKTARFVDELKVKIGGCSNCGFFNEELLSYLEFDHLNPKEKILPIATMIIQGYTLEQIIEECKKCRLICRMCHKIHTSKQIDMGVFDEDYGKIV